MKTIYIIIILVVLVALFVVSLLSFGDKSQECVVHGQEPEITSDECVELGGEVIDTLGDEGCCSEDNFLGTVIEMKCPCICCKR
jgi:hypothetical protein